MILSNLFILIVPYPSSLIIFCMEGSYMAWILRFSWFLIIKLVSYSLDWVKIPGLAWIWVGSVSTLVSFGLIGSEVYFFFLIAHFFHALFAGQFLIIRLFRSSWCYFILLCGYSWIFDRFWLIFLRCLIFFIIFKCLLYHFFHKLCHLMDRLELSINNIIPFDFFNKFFINDAFLYKKK